MSHATAEPVSQNQFSAAETAQIRSQIPYFERVDRLRAAGEPHPIYLDSAATSQRAAAALRAEYEFAAHGSAAVHRGTSTAVGEATTAFENSRAAVADFIGAGNGHTVVWSSGATGALNTLAGGFLAASIAATGGSADTLGVPGSERFVLTAGDEILVTAAEHHANLIPWQRLAAATGAKLVVVPVQEDGTWTLTDFSARVNDRTRVAAFTHVSNVTGWISPVAETVAAVRRGSGGRAVTVLDACQAVPHIPFNLSELGVDFTAFSGHKLYGPTGIGVLAARTELLNALPPAQTGGSAITKVDLDRAEFLPAPQRFEPGTQPVSQTVGLAAALGFMTELQLPRIAKTEESLVAALLDGVASLPGVTVIGPRDPAARAGLVAVTVDGVHAHDVGQILDSHGVLVRVGHHCAQPLHRALGLTASVRASVHAGTTADEVDAFIMGIKAAQKYFGVTQ